LGIHMVNLSPETKETINNQKELKLKITEEKGVLIVKVIPNSPAAKAGLKQGDTIVKVEAKAVDNSLQVQEQVEMSQIGKALKLEIIRDGKNKTIAVKPSLFPENE
jgi:S1-C subfamily serine protease